MRGKANDWKWKRQACRITPAYAGKSSIPASRQSSTQDHPRLCGEKGNIPDARYKYRGSPPPMRGKAASLYIPYVGIGITPAYAGKSKGGAENDMGTKDHPRLCGEKVHAFSFSSMFLGSPPPMRGKDLKIS